MQINTPQGTISGVELDGVVSFRGIPYAKPPIGDLRWRAPVPHGAWEGTRDGSIYPNRAFQPPLPESLGVGEIPGELSEDCLYLNVHTPSPDSRNRPVLVWIHGGGYLQGSANDFDPLRFAKAYDVVVVAMNYRIGMLGFLDLSRFGEEYAGSASIGFQDQMEALRWVQANIASYGGNPGKVTICGGSAGGGSVLALMGAPAAKGLFHQSIAISPAEVSHAPPDVVTPFASFLKMSEEAFLAHLLSLTGEEIFKMQTDAGIGGLACVDGKIVVKPAAEAIAASVNPVPMIAGSTSNEGPMLTQVIGDNEDGLRLFEMGLSPMTSGGKPERYTALLDQMSVELNAVQRLDRAIYDFFRASALRSVDALARIGHSAWLYLWDVPTEHPWGPTHGSDVVFAFNGLDPEVGDGEMRAFYRNNTTNRTIAAKWSATLAEFIRTGSPEVPGLPDWPAYNPDTRATLVLGAEPRVEHRLDDDNVLGAYGLDGGTNSD